MSEALIQLDDVKKVFLTDEVETHALAGIHMQIAKGEYVSISGPSGCGKSTLLAILGLLDSPSDGKYVLNGKSVEHLKASERARIRNREIGFIFQAFNLIGDLTVSTGGPRRQRRCPPGNDPPGRPARHPRSGARQGGPALEVEGRIEDRRNPGERCGDRPDRQHRYKERIHSWSRK